MVTAFSNIFSQEPHYIPIDRALERIRLGKSKEKVDEIRACLDKGRANELKKNLPCICFSGKFVGGRHDQHLAEHSGFIVLDFDDVDVPEKKRELQELATTYAAWTSPSGKGVKALVKIAKPEKHREHFEALRDIFPDADKSGVNVSRVCYESHDPEIYINPTAEIFTTVKETRIEVIPTRTDNDTFNNLLKWLSNRGDAFRTGERNLFLFKLASACCRFGLSESECERSFIAAFPPSSDFSHSETLQTIKKAYKANGGQFGSAVFEKDILVSKTTKREVEIDESIYDPNVRPRDVIYGEDVKQQAINIYLNGYEAAQTTYISDFDEYFKFKPGEITLLSGIGNYGKSTFLKYLLMLQVIGGNKKFAVFSPEEMPAEEFYHDLVEMYIGGNCTPGSLNRPTLQTYEAVYDFISQHIFFVYPKTISPTPEYIKERFLELIIKEKVSGCVIDPFNQLTNDYNSVGGRDDKYLETILSDFTRFAQTNQQYFVIVAHPHKLSKPKDSLNYPEPDVFDLAGGAMWNNKMDNILIYHRPDRGENPTSDRCTISSKKIRRQKIVGKLGTLEFRMDRRIRRYNFFQAGDAMERLIEKSFGVKQKPNDEEPF